MAQEGAKVTEVMWAGGTGFSPSGTLLMEGNITAVFGPVIGDTAEKSASDVGCR